MSEIDDIRAALEDEAVARFPDFTAAVRDLIDEVERLRDRLIQADLKIRSFPGADQSDVEFIRTALEAKP